MTSSSARGRWGYLPLLLLLLVAAGAFAYVQLVLPHPTFRLVCTQVAEDRSGLTFEVGRASDTQKGTTITIQYGDGTVASSEDRLGTIGRHTYRAHGSYAVTAEVHLSSNRLQRYGLTCQV